MKYALLCNRASQLRDIALNQGLLRLSDLAVIVDPKVHDTDRHFAMCSERADEIRVAPQLADQPYPIIDGILMHEIGHAADFAYKGKLWAEMNTGGAPLLMMSRSAWRGWKRRTPYVVERHADDLAEAIFSVRIGYVGPLMLQSTEGGVRPRPFGI